MHAGGRTGPGVACTLLGAILLLAGCRTPCPVRTPDSLGLAPDERRLSQALARYAEGLIYEVEGGAYSSNALAAFAEASRLDPSCASLNTRTAVAALVQNRPAVAVEALERSCRAHPDSVSHHVDLATAYQLTGRIDDAIGEYERAVRLDPRRVNSRQALAGLFLFQKKDAAALRTLRRAVKAVPEPGDVLAFAYAQAARLYQEKDTPRAILFFRFVLKHTAQPKQELQYLIGELYAAVGNSRLALRYYRDATQGPQPVPQAFVRLAMEEYAESPRKAIDMLEAAARRLPENVLFHVAMGQIYASQRRHAEALQQFENALRIAARSKDTTRRLTQDFYLQYAILLDQTQQGNKAEAVLEECIQSHTNADAALNFLAYSWAEKGIHLEKALQYVQRALAVEPDNGAYIDTLGWVYYRLGKYRDAALQIQRASELLPEDPTVLEHLGDALDMLGCPDDATEHWKRSYFADPERRSAADRLRARGLKPEDLLEPRRKPEEKPRKAR